MLSPMGGLLFHVGTRGYLATFSASLRHSVRRNFYQTTGTGSGRLASLILSRSVTHVNHHDYIVRSADISDVTKIWELLTSQEPDWPCDEHYLKTVLKLFPGTLVVGEDVKSKAIRGMCSGFPVNDEIGIVAIYLTHPDVRGHGLGKQIFEEVMTRLGDRNKFLDSVPEAVHLYERDGFRKLCGLTFWSGKIHRENLHQYEGRRGIEIREITKDAISDILRYDSKVHPIPREWFIKQCVFKETGVHVRMAIENSEIVGYGFTRPPSVKVYLDSLYANDADIARRILSSMLFDMPNEGELTVCIPDDNKLACSLATEIGLKPTEPLTRMNTKEPLKFPWDKIFFSNPNDFVLY